MTGDVPWKDYHIPSYAASLSSTLTGFINDGGFLNSYLLPRLMVDFKFLKNTVFPYVLVTLKMVDVSPIVPEADETYASTPSEDSRRLYLRFESE